MNAIWDKIYAFWVALIPDSSKRAFAEGALANLLVCVVSLTFFGSVNFFFGKDILKQVVFASYFMGIGMLLGMAYASYIDAKLYKERKEREKQYSLIK